MAGGLFEEADAIGEGGGSGVDGGGIGRICGGGIQNRCGRSGGVGGGDFDFGDEGGADDGGVGEAAEHGDVGGQRDAEADRDGESRDAARATEEGGEIVRKRIFGPRDTRARDEIEKTRGDGGDFGEALVGGGGRGEENAIEILGGEDAAVVVGLFGREIGDEDAVGASGCGGGGEFFQAHLENGIVVAEEDEGDFAGFADFTDEIEDFGEGGTGFKGAFGGALDGGAIGEGVAERDAEFDDVGASFGEGEDEF